MRKDRRQMLDEAERLSVVVTELVRLATPDDASTRSAARRLLAVLAKDPHMTTADRGLVRMLCQKWRSACDLEEL